MRNQETSSDLAAGSGRRGISIVIWMLTVVMSFASGVFVTLFALLREPVSQFSFQEFFRGPLWSAASIALVCFVLGIGFGYLSFRWHRENANRVSRNEYRTLRDRGETLRASQPARATEPDESSPEPPYAVQREAPQDIAAVISEMSDAIRANLREAGSTRRAKGNIGRSPRPKPSDE